jgi:Putative prokaryotic signal transducing protein
MRLLAKIIRTQREKMFCPVCEAEYEPGITTCADDGSALVERLTPENTAHDNSEARFVPLHNIGSPAEAEMVADILTQNGIRAAVQSGGMDALSPLLSAASPGAVVLVDERDFDRAREIYASFFGSDITPLTGTTAEEDTEENDERGVMNDE